MTQPERVYFDESPSMFRTSPGWFILWCLLTPAIIGIIALLIWRFQLSRTRLTIIGQRILFRTGVASTRESELRACDIRDIEITRTFWQNITGSGTLALSTSGESGMEVVVSGLAHPERVREIVNQLRST